MKRYMGYIIRSTENYVRKFLKTQVRDETRDDYGAFPTDMTEAKPTVYVLTSAVALYCNKNGDMYLSDELYDGINLGLDFVKRCQRADGSFDFPSCNFMSAADTAFCFKRLMGAYKILEKYGGILSRDMPSDSMFLQKTEVLKKKYYNLLYNAMTVITEGGFHTPNHRWAICAALMQGINMFPNHELRDKMIKRLNMYLDEGIDGNGDGEYAERSTGNYNAVVNNALIIMHEENEKLGEYRRDIDFLGYVKRNLHMMLTYVDTDNSIFTQNSTRQDYGRLVYMDKYFYQYLYIAANNVAGNISGAESSDAESSGAESSDAEFSGDELAGDELAGDAFAMAAHKIIKDSVEAGRYDADCLYFLMLRDKMTDYEFKGFGFPKTYDCFYKESGVGRVKTDGYVYSVLRGKCNFLYFKTNDTLISMRIGESIGSVRNFIPDKIERTENGFKLQSRVEARYYEPFEEKPDTSDWWSMDHEKRKIIIKGGLDVTVYVTGTKRGLDVRILSQGLEGVPLRIGFIVQPGAEIYNEHFNFIAGRGGNIILKNGSVNIRHNTDIIRIGEGFGTHSFRGHYNGEESMDGVFVISMNDYTPFDRTISLQIV